MNQIKTISHASFGVMLCTLTASPLAAQIDPTEKYAWSESSGWLNHRASHGEVLVFDDHLEGFAWGQNIGWVKLGSHSGGGAHSYANTSASDWGVNQDGAGNLSGYGWSETVGWINFNPSHGQVTIDPTSGDFDGYAWGANIGWIHFNSPTNAYRVGVVAFASGTIGDSSCLVRTKSISGIADLTAQVELLLDLTHTSDQDLDIYLRAPTGQILELSSHNGGSGDNYTNTRFSDSGATNITAGTPPFTGTYQPQGSLNPSGTPCNLTPTITSFAALDGLDPNGDWTLFIGDNAIGETGTLNWARLFITTSCGPGRTLPASTWLMTAPPCDPNPADLASQLGSDLGGTYGSTWISFYWDTATQSYQIQNGTDSLIQGVGNWHYSYIAGDMVLDGTPTPVTADCSTYGLTGSCFEIDLTRSSGSDLWQMVGHPFPYTVGWANVRIAAFNGTDWTAYTPSAAQTAGYINKSYWTYNGSGYDSYDDVTPGMIGTLQPQESFWVRIFPGTSVLSGLKLLIPAL